MSSEFTHTARLVLRRTEGGVWLAVTCGARTTGQRPCCPFPFGTLSVERDRFSAIKKAFGSATYRLPVDNGQTRSFRTPVLRSLTQPDEAPASWPNLYLGPWWKVNLRDEIELITEAQRHAKNLRRQGKSLVDFEVTDPPVYRRRVSDQHMKVHPLLQLMKHAPPPPPKGYTWGLFGLIRSLHGQPAPDQPPKRTKSVDPVTHPWHLVSLAREPVFRCPVHGPNRVDALVILDEFAEVFRRLESEVLDTE